MTLFQATDPDGLLRLIPDGAATVAVIVVVTLFLRFLKEHRQESAKERSEDRAEFRGALRDVTESHERVAQQIATRVDKTQDGVEAANRHLAVLTQRLEEHIREE